MTVIKLKKETIKINKSPYINEARLEAIETLESQLAEAKAELRLLSIELKQIERDLNRFLDNYYNSVGDIINQNKKFDDFSSLNPSNNNTKLNHDEKSDASTDLNEVIKKLYKKLSKMCHPDIQHDNTLNRLFNSVNQAYIQKNLQELIKIEEYLSGENDNQGEGPKDKIERLSKEYDQVLEKIRILKNSKENMLESPEYELRRQVLWARMCGQDLISKIKSDISRQLTESLANSE